MTAQPMGLERLGSGAPVLVIGRAGMDLYADPPGATIENAARFTTDLGGSAANIAVAIRRAGHPAAILTRVSDDAVGRFCLNRLDDYQVDRAHVRATRGEARNSLAVVETRLAGCQSVIYRNGAADFALTLSDVEAVDFSRYGALVATGTALAAQPSRSATFRAMELARAAGLDVVLDLDYRPYSWPSSTVAAEICARAAAICNVVVGNDVEFGLLAGDPDCGLDAARILIAEGVRLVIFKMGERGAITLTPEGELRTGIFQTSALKPTGAGDAFLGNLIAALSRGVPLRDAVLRGSAAAAMVVARVGCASAMPTDAELADFLTHHSGLTTA